jgi:hypothetical protein
MTVGAGLLAITMVKVMPPSLASQLLQVCGCMVDVGYDTDL